MPFLKNFCTNFTFNNRRYEDKACFSALFSGDYYKTSNKLSLHFIMEPYTEDSHYIRFSREDILHFERWAKAAFGDFETDFDIYGDHEFWNVYLDIGNYTKKELVVILTLLRVIQENNLYGYEEQIFPDLLEIEKMGASPFTILLIFCMVSRNQEGHNIFKAMYNRSIDGATFSPYTTFEDYRSELKKCTDIYVNTSKYVNKNISNYINECNENTKLLLTGSSFNCNEYVKGAIVDLYTVLKKENFFIEPKINKVKNARTIKSKSSSKKKELLTVYGEM